MYESVFEADFEGLTESDFEYDEFDEFDEFDESDERSRRRGSTRGRARPRLKTPPRGNATVQPPKAGFATKAELDATAKKLDARIATNSTAIKTLDGRTRAAEREVGSIGAALKKEITLRKKETTDLKKGLDESRQIAMIMPLLQGSGDDKFNKILPVLLYGGMLGGSVSGTGGTDNSMMMTMMMVIAMQD